MAKRRRPAGSQSAGYHADLSIPGYKPKTPTKAPPPSEAARGPAGLYAGAAKEYTSAVTALPAPAQVVTVAATKRAEARQAVRAERRKAHRLVSLVRQSQAQRARTAVKAPVSYEAPKVAARMPAPVAKAPTPTKPVVVAPHVRSAPMRKANPQVNPAKAVISSTPQPEVTRQERKAARQNLRQAKKAVKRSRVARKLPIPYEESPEQQKVARTVLRTGKEEGASRKELLAAAETGLVEAPYFKNPASGDADSEGWRQERTSIYGTGPTGPTNVKASAKRFFQEAKTDPTIPGGGGETPGELAQTVQGSAFPERYEEHRGEAEAIVKAFYRGKASPKAIRNLKAAKQEAKELGLKVGGPGIGKPPKPLVKRTVAAERAMKEVEGTPYVWGGGHNSGSVDPSGGLDCSGAVSYVLQHVGVKLPGGVTSGDMGSYLKPGPGALTVFYNPEHTFLRLINKKGEAEYWGTSVGDSGAGGLTRHDTPSASYLAEYNVGHVPGMGKKQALQMGATPGSLTGTSPESFPGMSFSEGGTTATIDQGAGTTVNGKPGASKGPIQLTPRQRYNRTNRKLKSLGVGVKSTATSHPANSVLATLEKKYLGA